MSAERLNPPAAVAAAWQLTVQRPLGGRDNQHWLAEVGGEPVVLRGSPDRPGLDLDYELTVLRRLASRGWPVPRPLAGPERVGDAWWCLFTHLPGTLREDVRDVAAERRARGRLMAELHLATADLVDLGQRGGWRTAPEVVDDPRLDQGLARYARARPREARILGWHRDRARDLFAAHHAGTAPRRVLHGDVVPWNLLHAGDRLTGLLDFELTHLDLRVSEFALSWRGAYDEVVAGYLDVTDLDEREQALITPAYWAWALIDIADELNRFDPATDDAPTFDWTITHLLRRSPLMGPDAAPYLD